MKKLLVAAALTAFAAFGADWKITYSVAKNAKPDAEVPITIMVKDAKGAPVEGADVMAVLTMVDMDHGEFKFNAKQSKPGVYETKGKFLMSGAWQIEVRAKMGAESASQKFRYELKD